MKKEEIEKEVELVKDAIAEFIKDEKNDYNSYFHSWWFNHRNSKLGIPTPRFNRRCNVLIERGYLTKDDKSTSTSSGTRYVLTEKFINEIKLTNVTFENEA